MATERLYLGIDAGGTQTLALLIASDGRVVGRGRSGPANHVTVGLEQARQSITAAARAALHEAPTVPVAVALGSAGLEQTGPLEVALELLPPELHTVRIAFDTDGVMALEGALGGDPGVVVAAGTGSIAMGRDVAGNMAYAGGWGWRAGDEGSAYWLGQQALMRVFQAADGRAPATVLTQELLTATHCADCVALRDWVYAPERTADDVAGLAPCVDAAARKGDAAAEALLAHGAQELAVAVSAVAKRLGLPADARVSYTGGVFRSELMLEHFQAALRRIAPMHVQTPVLSPAGGAALHAWRIGQNVEPIWRVTVPATLVGNLKNSLLTDDALGK